MLKQTFIVTGMTCSACSARVEKAVGAMDLVKSASVNLLTNTLVVEFSNKPDFEAIVSKVVSLGYGAQLKDAKPSKKTTQAQNNNQKSDLKRRLIVSIAFTVPLFYFSMGSMLRFPMPSFFIGNQNALVFAFSLFLLTLPVLIVNRNYYINGFKNLIKRSPNMDSLIAIGSGAAFLYGIFAIYKIGWGLGHGDMHTVHKFSMDLYLESAAMILTLITLGNFFQSRAKGKTSAAIAKLIDLAPKTAIVLREGIEQEIALDEVNKGDILIVKAGAAIAADGVIVDGFGLIDQSSITGESMPVEKKTGDKVIGGTVNKTGYFKMQAQSVGADTALSKIIKLVEDATLSKAPIARLADKISGIFVPAVIGVALISMAVWLALGYGFEFAMTVGVSVLVISCPCALGLATPTAIMVGTGKGAANGILIKSAESLEVLHGINVAVLDKTGTVTQGRPSVCDIFPINAKKDELIRLAASLEKMSNHPFAAAIVKESGTMQLHEVEGFELLQGMGIAGNILGNRVFGGNLKLMSSCGVDLAECEKIEQNCAHEGKTPLFFAKDGVLLGAFVLADAVKSTSANAVSMLQKMGIEVVMLTGDNENTARAIASQVGINNFVAQVLPDDKEFEVSRLQEEGKRVAMIGDGINDAPALARADVGIAIGAGTDIAIESADIVLIKSDLTDAARALRLSKATMRTIKQNLFWAFLYNVIGIPVAAGVLYAATGWLLNPMIAAAAMSLSSVSVVVNALRLNLLKVNKNNVKEIKNMTSVLKIEGMTCPHCVAHVTKALQAITGVSNVTVSLSEKTASIEHSDSVSLDALRNFVIEAGYNVV